MKWENKGHEFDKYYSYYKDIKMVYIYGAGQYANIFLDLLPKFNNFHYDIEFIDIDIEKQKTGFRNYNVLSPESFFAKPKKDHIVLVGASIENTIVIMSRLAKNGYTEGINCFKLSWFLSIYSVYEENMVYFPSISFIPSTKCNLNCYACLNFNPYNKNQINIEFETLKDDIDLFFNCVDYIGQFHISGGEPLLYPYLNHLISYISDNYSSKIHSLELTSNGTIIPTNDMLNIFRENNVTIILDDYRESVELASNNLDIIIAKFNEFSVKYSINKVMSWIDLNPLGTIHSNWTDIQLTKFCEECRNPFQELRDKKLYSCNYASYAMKAGLNEDSTNDYYDLSDFTPNKKKELIEFRLGFTHKGYVDFCKRCGGLSSLTNKNTVEVAKQVNRIVNELK